MQLSLWEMFDKEALGLVSCRKDNISWQAMLHNNEYGLKSDVTMHFQWNGLRCELPLQEKLFWKQLFQYTSYSILQIKAIKISFLTMYLKKLSKSSDYHPTMCLQKPIRLFNLFIFGTKKWPQSLVHTEDKFYQLAKKPAALRNLQSLNQCLPRL